jgi:hypothetical protein
MRGKFIREVRYKGTRRCEELPTYVVSVDTASISESGHLMT